VQHRDVGAVELHQRERERSVEGLALHGLRHPRPRRDRPDRRDLDELGDRLVGHRVELRRWHDDRAVRRTPADDPAVAQPGEEAPDDRTRRAGVVERYGDRC